MKGIIGKKIGMTSIFDAGGKQTACTIIEAGPCVVTQVKTQEIDGYNALQVAYGDKKEKHTLSAEKNHFAKANTPAKKFIKEFRDSSLEKNIGDSITVDIFAEGDKVEAQIQLEVRRDRLAEADGDLLGQVEAHPRREGCGRRLQRPDEFVVDAGAIGGSSYPARVFKGMRMAGRMGQDRVKVKGLKVMKVFPDKNYILVSGSVPGHNGSIVLIQK